MTPPCYTFPATELPDRVQLDLRGRQRKMHLTPAPKAAIGSSSSSDSAAETATAKAKPGYRPHIDLARDCVLLTSMVQYSCLVQNPERRDSPVRCWPVQRLFRRCQDRNGSFMVETTAWEEAENPAVSAGGSK